MSKNYPKTDILKELQDQKFALDQAAIVARTDANGTILYVNQKLCEISGYSQEELVGQNHRILASGVHDRLFFRALWSTISSGKIWRGDICNKSKAGEFYWVATTIVPFCDEQGVPYQYLAIRQDITAFKNAQQVITEQQSKLVLASRLAAIGEMSAAITHEINNPLGVVLGRCEMLLNMLDKGINDPAQLRRVVESIETTGRRIEKIVRGMRSLGHHGEEEPMFPTKVKAMLEDTLDLCTQRFRSHGLEVYVPQVPTEMSVECRSHEIVQILVNLLNNAYDASVERQQMDREAGKIKSENWVKIAVQDLGSEVLISVSDAGYGLTEAVQAKLFDPFFSTKKVQYGTGLGLSISRSIALKHKGNLKYDSSNAHTTFNLILPKKQPRLEKSS